MSERSASSKPSSTQASLTDAWDAKEALDDAQGVVTRGSGFFIVWSPRNAPDDEALRLVQALTSSTQASLTRTLMTPKAAAAASSSSTSRTTLSSSTSRTIDDEPRPDQAILDPGFARQGVDEVQDGSSGFLVVGDPPKASNDESLVFVQAVAH